MDEKSKPWRNSPQLLLCPDCTGKPKMRSRSWPKRCKAHLRIAAPNDYGSCTFAPLAAAFSKKFPACRVDLMLADTKDDLVANQIDLWIRVGWLKDSNLQARRIVGFRQLLVAAPGVVKKRAVAQPNDLASLPFVANGALREPLQWQFTKNDFERQTVRMNRTLTINSTPAVMAATLAGAGLAIVRRLSSIMTATSRWGLGWFPGDSTP